MKKSARHHASANGRTRLCHGDLHLRNICLFEGRPQGFSTASNSTRPLADIDTLYYLAFLLMDLLHRDLAWEAVPRRQPLSRPQRATRTLLPCCHSSWPCVRRFRRSWPARRSPGARGTPELEKAAQDYLALAFRLLETRPDADDRHWRLQRDGQEYRSGSAGPRIGAAPRGPDSGEAYPPAPQSALRVSHTRDQAGARMQPLSAARRIPGPREAAKMGSSGGGGVARKGKGGRGGILVVVEGCVASCLRDHARARRR